MMAPAHTSTGWVEDRQFRWWPPVLVFVAMFMLQMPDGFSWEYVGRLNLYEGSSTQIISKIQWFPLFGLGTWLLFARFRLTFAMLPHLNWFLIAAMAWTMLSSLWSYDPSLTLRRSIKVLGTLVLAWGVVMVCWDYARFERMTRWSMLAFLVASMIFIAVKPTLGIHQAYENETELAGCWRGLSSHKNPFGVMASVGLLLWVHAWFTTEKRWVSVVAMIICVICLIGARSSTSLLCGVSSIALLIFAYKSPLARRPAAFFVVAGALFLVPALWFVILNGMPTIEQALGPLTKLLGRDLTFTGRVPLWNAVLEEIPHWPLMGTGYQAFWGPPGAISDAARAKAGWISVNGHNGYLDTTNEIGLIGISLLMAAVWFDIRRAARFSALSVSTFALHLSIQFYQLLSNLSETMFIRTISLTFLLTAMSSFHLARMSLDLDLRRRANQPHANTPTALTTMQGSPHAHS